MAGLPRVQSLRRLLSFVAIAFLLGFCLAHAQTVTRDEQIAQHEQKLAAARAVAGSRPAASARGGERIPLAARIIPKKNRFFVMVQG